MPAEPPGDLGRYGWDPHWDDAARDIASGRGLGRDVHLGRVVRHDGIALRVARGVGVDQLPLRGALPPVTVGDWVLVEDEAVAALVPRRNALRRRDEDREEAQLLAANVDVVLVVCGLDRPVKQGRIQRSLMLAHDAGATPVIVLTKADVDATSTDQAERVRGDNPGVEVVVTSADGSGLAHLARLVAGHTAVMVGESGAGKSTLTNLLIGDVVARTGDVRATDAKGRHTTTTRELHVLPGGGVVVDSPGIRSVGVWADAASLADGFDDIDELAQGCRFRDCAHRSEPGCAVRAALEDGRLARERLAAWHALAD